ncbi:hypothetical protein DFQ26_005811 [Actinomortierella ambigua]|nr:hypothetical protein DFQ26_005811 [Actinomortierella ambigua]
MAIMSRFIERRAEDILSKLHTTSWQTLDPSLGLDCICSVPGNPILKATTFFSGLNAFLGSKYGCSHEIMLAFHKKYGKIVRLDCNAMQHEGYAYLILVTEDYPKSVIHEGFELIGQPDLFSARDKDFHRARTFNPWMKYIIPVDYSFFNFAVERVRARRDLGEKGRRSDLLQYLLDAQAREIEEGNGPTGNEAEDIRTGKLTNKAIEIEAFVFLIAGSETTSTALTWALLYLVKHQDKLKRLREEIDGATSGNPSNQLPKLEQVRKLPYLDAVLNESFRLRPVAATGIPREVPEDREMLGHKIPKGTICLAQIRQLHSDPLFFPKPDEFIPERWIPSESPFPPIQDFTFYPFSAGTRNCVGKNFAMMELRLILSAIVSTYDLEFIPGQNERYLQFITTVFVAGQYLISMKRRS